MAGVLLGAFDLVLTAHPQQPSQCLPPSNERMLSSRLECACAVWRPAVAVVGSLLGGLRRLCVLLCEFKDLTQHVRRRGQLLFCAWSLAASAPIPRCRLAGNAIPTEFWRPAAMSVKQLHWRSLQVLPVINGICVLSLAMAT